MIGQKIMRIGSTTMTPVIQYPKGQLMAAFS
jgi:hypothetical protein